MQASHSLLLRHRNLKQRRQEQKVPSFRCKGSGMFSAAAQHVPVRAAPVPAGGSYSDKQVRLVWLCMSLPGHSSNQVAAAAWPFDSGLVSLPTKLGFFLQR